MGVSLVSIWMIFAHLTKKEKKEKKEKRDAFNKYKYKYNSTHTHTHVFRLERELERNLLLTGPLFVLCRGAHFLSYNV